MSSTWAHLPTSSSALQTENLILFEEFESRELSVDICLELSRSPESRVRDSGYPPPCTNVAHPVRENR